MPSTNHQGSHGTKSQLSSFQTSLQNTKFCDSIRYQMKMFAFVQLFLGRTSLTSMPARFFDVYGSELVLMHSGFQLLLRWWETQYEASIIHPNSHICLSFKCISIVHVAPSCNKHLETDGLFPSRVQSVTRPGGREGKA